LKDKVVVLSDTPNYLVRFSMKKINDEVNDKFIELMKYFVNEDLVN